jgi:hypothetical protein
VGLVINYAPERAVRYDLEGKVVEILSGAYLLGEGHLHVGRKRWPSAQAEALFTRPTIDR